MGRPRQYQTPAARQAAYRERQRANQVLTDRQWLDQVEMSWSRLQAVVAPLARQGDPLACHLYRANLVTALETLTTWFQAQQTDHATEAAAPAPHFRALCAWTWSFPGVILPWAMRIK